jgi:hypothetical protein
MVGKGVATGQRRSRAGDEGGGETGSQLSQARESAQILRHVTERKIPYHQTRIVVLRFFNRLLGRV